MSTKVYEFRNKILSLFYESNSLFLKKHYDNIVDNVSERNLCSCLSYEIYNLLNKYGLSDYFVDVEYNRNGGKIKSIINDEEKVINIICDLIIHSRGHNRKDNLLALEMKKLPCNEIDLNSDRTRLKALTKHEFNDIFSYDGHTLPKNVCDYEVGIYYLIDINRQIIKLELYGDGNLINIETNTFEYFFNFK